MEGDCKLGREGVAMALDAARERIAELEAALSTTHKLIVEAAMTGFNCHDGDWVERLFANQGSINAALRG